VSEVDQPHRYGHIIPTEVVIKFLHDPQTGTLTVLGVSRDVTTCRQAEVALIAERNSLARRVEDLSRVNTELSRAVRAKDEAAVPTFYSARLSLEPPA